MIIWSHLLRYLTRNRSVPTDAELRDKYGTWGWLTGRGMWRPDPTEQPCTVTTAGLHPEHTHTCAITWPHDWHECPCGASFEA